MEKGHQYSWMWSKRNRHEYAGVDDSWEEQAFAEDAAGLLGGCVWPPRSYTCSFCRREFRSAQALGGHMNVHRRDRARLKQFPNAQSEILNQQHNNNQGYKSNNNHLPCSAASSMGVVKYPPQNCALSNYNPNPNSQCYSVSDASTAPAAVRFSSQSQEITTINNKVMVPPRNNYIHSPTAGANGNKASSLSLAPTSQSSKVVAHDQNTTTCVVNQQDHHQRRYNSRNDYIVALDSMRGNEEDDHVRSDLSISLSLILRKNHPMSKSDDDPNVEAAGNSTCGCKKRKLDISSSSPPIFIDHVQPTSFSLGNMLSEAAADAKDVNSSEMHKIKYRSKVELDLELRLGNGST